MSKFGCPYSRYIPRSALLSRQRNIKGEIGTTGIDLGRRWLPLKEVIQGFVELMSSESQPKHFDTEFFDDRTGEKRVVDYPGPSKQLAVVAGMKSAFDTIAPFTVACFVRRQSRQPLLATSSRFRQMLTVPVCRIIYGACFLFTLLTTTYRLLNLARPVQVISMPALSVVSTPSTTTGFGHSSTNPETVAHGAPCYNVETLFHMSMGNVCEPSGAADECSAS